MYQGTSDISGQPQDFGEAGARYRQPSWAEPWSTQSSYNLEGARSINARQSGSAPDIPAFSVQPVTLNPLNTQQGNPSFRMESQVVTPRASSFRRTGGQARNSFRASAENRIPPFSADGQYQDDKISAVYPTIVHTKQEEVYQAPVWQANTAGSVHYPQMQMSSGEAVHYPQMQSIGPLGNVSGYSQLPSKASPLPDAPPMPQVQPQPQPQMQPPPQRHARDGSVTSMFGTSAYQYNPRHSAAPSEMPRGIKPEPNSEGTVATVPPTDDLVKLGKRKAWAKFLAYEGSFQVCLDKIGDSKEAQSFLAEGCRPLKTAFAFDSLLLRPAAAGVPPGGQTIVWDDSEATVLPAPMSRELLEAPPSPPQPHHQASRSVIVMSQHAPQQSMQQVETIPGRPVIKASAVRLVSSHLYQPFEQDKMGTLQSLFGKVPGTADQLYICLHPASAPEEAAAWTVVQAGGRGKSGDQVELGQEEVDEELLVEVHNYQEPVAQGIVRAADLLQAAHNSPAQGHGSPRKQKQAGFISRLCGRSSQSEDAHVPGKKWVQVFDHAGAKWGHVLLSSWLDTSEERTVMHQSSPPPPMMQPLMALPQQPYLPPPPSYLPPLQNTRDLGGVVSQGKGYHQLTSWQVYDVVLDAALHTQKCGPRNLLVTGEWEWLLNGFADFYGIRQTYTVLAHLRWAIKQENATVTAECLEILSSELKPLKEAEANGGLLPQEVAILSRVENATESLLARCFENYYSLQENAPNGLLDGGVAAAEQPAPALQPAVELCNILRDVLKPGDQQWLTDRFKVAANRRYHRLLDGADATISRGGRGSNSPPDSPRGHQHPGGPLGNEAPHYDPSQGVPIGPGTEQDAEAAYHRMELLSQSIRNELQRDLHIHDSAVLPNFINLPQVTAAEYTRLYLSALQETLDRYPPPQPSEAAVNLLVTVGQQQEFLLWHSLLPPPGHPGSLDALEVFTPHVERWIRNSQEALCQRCHQLEGSTQALQGGVMGEDGKSHIAPLVGEMLQRIQAEVARYERVITYWPSFGPTLEAAVCAALRTTTAAVSRQCGLIPMIGNEEEMGGQAAHQRKASNVYGGSGPPQKSPRLWKFAPARGGNANNTGVLPFEAILLNSLRRLLTVVPQTEHTLSRWCGSHSGQRPGSPHAGPPSPGRDGAQPPGALAHDGPGPHLGAQFAQLVKELRSEYAAAVTACAERIAGALFQRPGYSINATLHRHGISGTPSIMQQQVGPVLEAMEDILAALLRSLDGRVYVAVGRGLWDFTSKDIYDYVDSLQEGKENKGAWRGRQNAAAALSVVDNFFTAVLSGTLQHELQSKDLDLPLHSDRAHKLLAENTAAINMSYTVY